MTRLKFAVRLSVGLIALAAILFVFDHEMKRFERVPATKPLAVPVMGCL